MYSPPISDDGEMLVVLIVMGVASVVNVTVVMSFVEH